MAIVHIDSATDTIGSQLTKINNTQDEIPVSGSYSSGTLTLTKFGGGNFTVTGFTSGGASSISQVFTIGSGSQSVIPTGYTASSVIGANSSLLGGSGTMSITGSSSAIVAGFQQAVYSPSSIIGGGIFNIIRGGGNYNGIFAGISNEIQAGVYGGTIAGGANNTINSNSLNSFIYGGSANTIDSNITNSSILAGQNITNSLSNVAMASGFAIPSGTSQGRLFIQRGTNSISGKDTLGGGGTKTVNTTRAESTSIILLTPQSSLNGTLYISSISDGTSFTVNSTDNTDTCSFGWLIISDIVA